MFELAVLTNHADRREGTTMGLTYKLQQARLNLPPPAKHNVRVNVMLTGDNRDRRPRPFALVNDLKLEPRGKLYDIRDNALYARQFVEDITFEVFQADRKTFYAAATRAPSIFFPAVATRQVRGVVRPAFWLCAP